MLLNYAFRVLYVSLVQSMKNDYEVYCSSILYGGLLSFQLSLPEHSHTHALGNDLLPSEKPYILVAPQSLHPIPEH